MLLSTLTLTLAVPLLPQSSERRNPEFEALSRRWGSAVEAGLVPGLAVCVVEGDELLHLEVFGTRDVEDPKPVTPDTQFYIASATKPFVAFATQQLAEQGRLELDHEVSRHLPRLHFAEGTPPWSVRDLLCHKPGIQSFPVVFLDAYTGEITDDRYYHFLSEVVPTGRVTYTNLHFTLAGRVLESVVGKPWKEVLREQIFAPLGMERTTGYATSMYAGEDVAFPSVLMDGEYRHASVRKCDETMHAAGGLGTTIHDLSRWLRVHLNEGSLEGQRLLSPEGIEEMVREQSRIERGDVDGFGLGWMRSSFLGQRRLQHGGGYIGSAALISFLPELGVGVAVLSNTDRMGNALCDLVTEDVFRFFLAEAANYDPLPGLHDRFQQNRRRSRSASGPVESSAPSAEGSALSLAPQSYVGGYTSEHWGTFVVREVEGRLRGKLGNLDVRITPLGKDRFQASSGAALDAESSFLVESGAVRGISMSLRNREIVFER